jgi:RNA polymerase sigma factor (sigma-70 family)
LAAVPSIGRANRVEGVAPVEADLTRALYEEYANQIFRYCLHQLGSREEAEDAVQSTFLNAFRGIKRGVVPELESAWLFKIAHNVCLSRRRSSWRRGRIESPADFEVVEELTAAPARRADELIGLQDVLEQMPESQRRAILLREWQGLSYREIAEELELSQAAVETLIFRARRALASGLEQPPEKQKRLARALDWGNVATAIKSILLGGSAAAKVAATVAVVSATTVVAASPVQQHRAHHTPAGTRTPAPAAQPKPAGVTQPVAATAVAPAAPAPRALHTAQKRAVAPTGASTVVPTSDATVAPETSAPAATPPAAPAAPAPVPPAAVPATEPEATVGKSDDTPKESKQGKDGAKDSGKHGKSEDANGKGANGGVEQPQPQPPVVTQPVPGPVTESVTIPVQQVPAAQPPTAPAPAGESKGGPKPDHGSHKQQGGGSDVGGSVSTPPVTTQPVTPAVTSIAQSVVPQGGGKQQERDTSGS